MKIIKTSKHHIRFDTGDAIKLTPTSFSFVYPERLVGREFSEHLAFSETLNGFVFGNLPSNMCSVVVNKEGVSNQAALYWQGRNVMELDF